MFGPKQFKWGSNSLIILYILNKTQETNHMNWIIKQSFSNFNSILHKKINYNFGNLLTIFKFYVEQTIINFFYAKLNWNLRNFVLLSNSYD